MKQKKEKKQFADLLHGALQKARIDLTNDQIHKLELYHRMLRDANETLNLTRIHNMENIIRKQFIDSLILLPILQENQISLKSPVMDLGSGPGLPGIPLAIARPDLSWILVEGRKNRCEFLSHVVEELGLKNCEVRSRKLISSDSIDSQFIITRAFSSIPETLYRSSGSLNPGGMHLLMKGPHCDSEIQEVQNLTPSGILPDLDHFYVLPDSHDKRRLVVYLQNNEFSQLQTKNEKAELPWLFETIPYTQIESTSNKEFKTLRTLNNGRSVKKHGLTIASGQKIVQEILEEHPTLVDSILFSRESLADQTEKIESSWIASVHSASIKILSKSLFEEIDFFGTGGPLLSLKTREIPLITMDELRTLRPAIILPLTDPENLGASCRSAKAFGFSKIILSAGSANPYHPRSVRASAGTVIGMDFFRFNEPEERFYNALEKLDHLFALDMNGRALGQVDLPELPIFLVGTEGQGIPHTFSGERLSIPISNDVESLNASVSLSILLYEWYSRHSGLSSKT